MNRTIASSDLEHIKVITVDYGGVLAHHYCEPYQSLLAKMLGVSVEQSKALVSEKSEQGILYRTGRIDRAGFWSKVAEIANTATNLDDYSLQLMWAKTYILDQRVFDLLQVLRSRKKMKLGILSNTDFDRLVYIERTYGLSEYFDIEIYSCQTQSMKTDSASFLKLINDAGENTAPENILVIDDRESAVQRAADAGLNAYLYTGYNDLVHFLKRTKILTDELLF